MNDTPKSQRIAFRSTQGSGVFAKDRWTELAVHYFYQPSASGNRWALEITGKSSREGDRDLTTTHVSPTLEGVLAYLNPDSTPGRIVAEEARAWERQYAAGKTRMYRFVVVEGGVRLELACDQPPSKEMEAIVSQAAVRLAGIARG